MTFDSIEALLNGEDPTYRPAELDRLRSAVRDFVGGGATAGIGDVLGLLHTALWRAHLSLGLSRGDPPPSVLIRNAANWGDHSDFARFGFELTNGGNGAMRARALAWEPRWVLASDPSGTTGIDDASAATRRRTGRTVPADPAITAIAPGITTYLSPGQREAVRAAYLGDAGGTFIVNLPTGSGKTLAFQAPALTGNKTGGLTVVVVPTVALAQDQEERFRELLEPDRPPCALAYHSGLTRDARFEVVRRIATGLTPVVFTSPEAVLGALRSTLYQCAREGRLRVFAVDEAHTVSSWGDNFRPDFHALAGLRDELLDQCPPGHAFRTLLLTATLTAEAYDTLNRLFGRKRRPELVSELFLRPEPTYLVARAPSADERTAWVLDAARRCPRPFLIYVTRREDAARWEGILQSEGILRVRSVVGGDMHTESGQATLAAWRNGELDGIAATSAFGLGVDKADVRTVIHACLPETLDRFYQEVGRAGRDGKAALSILVTEPGDDRVAESLGIAANISAEKAFDRWTAMIQDAKQTNTPDIRLVPLHTTYGAYTISTNRNRAWNYRTLTLMAKARLIEFAPPPLPQHIRSSDETDEQYEANCTARLSLLADHVGVRRLTHDDANQVAFAQAIEDARTAAYQADVEALNAMRAFRDGRRPLDELLTDAYCLPDADVSVAPSRLACPVRRKRGTQAFENPCPRVTGINSTATSLTSRMTQVFDRWKLSEHPILVLVDVEPASASFGRSRSKLNLLLPLLAKHGVAEFDLAQDAVSPDVWRRMADESPWRFVVRTADDERGPVPVRTEFPLFSYRPPTMAKQALEVAVRSLRELPHVVLIPDGLEDPTHPHRKFQDIHRTCAVDAFISEVSR